MDNIYIIDAKRTAIGKFLGSLYEANPKDVCAQLIKNGFKEEYINKCQNHLRIKEQEAREKYNPDNLFKNSKVKTQNFENTTITEETAIVEYKEKNFIQKIFDKIRNLFKKS